MSEPSASPPLRYSFGGMASVGTLLGRPTRQVVPIVVGSVAWVLLAMIGFPLVGVLGPLVGAVVSFGSWRQALLFDVAVPGIGHVWRRRRGALLWTRSCLFADEAEADDLPPALAGIELLEVPADRVDGRMAHAVVWDRRARTVSAVVRARAHGFPVASGREQDVMVQAWGSTLASFVRARATVSRIIWQEWARPEGVGDHRDFLHSVGSDRGSVAASDYDALLDQQGSATITHEVLLTLQVDLAAMRARRKTSALDAAIGVLGDELGLLAERLEAAGVSSSAPLSVDELRSAIRLRANPSGRAQSSMSLAASVGRGGIEWGPMAVETTWDECRVDESIHRTYRVATWPQLPVAGDWLGPLLVGSGGSTRTVTVVMEPVSLIKAAATANRQLTTLGADHDAKSRAGFRQTAGERRRASDVEARERELAEGFAEFRFVGFVTVTAPTLDELEATAAGVELAAAQSMLDIRPMAARHDAGWVCSLPVGRTVRRGVLT